MTKRKKSAGMSDIKKEVLIGAGVAALAAAGTYFLYGSRNADKHRKMVKSWMLKAKGEVLEQLESLTHVDDQIYHRIVKEVTDKYHKIKNVDPKELAGFITELKGHWENMKDARAPKTKSRAKVVSKIKKFVGKKKSK